MPEILRKPAWLKTKLPKGNSFIGVQKVVKEHHLHTICSSGKCPNMGECWGDGTATFMILGDICTRSCGFCNTKTGKPFPPNALEPQQVAKSIDLMKLKHAVITSVDRDDLTDFGAGHWAHTIRAIRDTCPNTTMEVLIPDFQGNTDLIDVVIEAKPDIISHNLETVEELTSNVRSSAKYHISLKVLKHIANSGIKAKSGIMLGMGETDDQIKQTLEDMMNAGVSIVTLGQYLQPTLKHLPVIEYVTPQKFSEWKLKGLEMGFAFVESAPLVRSSYHAENHI